MADWFLVPVQAYLVLLRIHFHHVQVDVRDYPKFGKAQVASFVLDSGDYVHLYNFYEPTSYVMINEKRGLLAVNENVNKI